MSLVKLKQIAQSGAADGDVATWDDTAGLWVPGAPKISFNYLLSRDGATNEGTYLRMPDQVPVSASPIVAPFDCELVFASASCSKADDGAWGIEILNNGLQAATVTGAVTVLKIYSGVIAVSFSQGDEIEVRTDPAGDKVEDPIAQMFFREV